MDQMQCSFEQFFSSFTNFFFLHSFMNFLFLIIPGHVETLVFDVLKVEWSVAVASLPSSITTNKVSHIDFVLCIIKYCKSF